MGNTPKRIAAAVGTGSPTDLYTFPSSSVTWAELATLDFTNTTTADITMDVWWLDSDGSTKRYMGDDILVPAKGNASWRGLVVFDTNPQKLQAQATATGVDVVGTVMEHS